MLWSVVSKTAERSRGQKHDNFCDPMAFILHVITSSQSSLNSHHLSLPRPFSPNPRNSWENDKYYFRALPFAAHCIFLYDVLPLKRGFTYKSKCFHLYRVAWL